MSFEWEKDCWKYSHNDESIVMTVKDADENILPMSILESNDAKEMLGVSLAPDGNHTQQFQILKKKMEKFAEFIRVGHVNRHEAWLSLTMMSLKSLEYVSQMEFQTLA